MKRLTEEHLQKLERLKKEKFLLECVEKLNELNYPNTFPPKREDYYRFAGHIYDIAMKYGLTEQKAIFTLMLAWHVKGDAVRDDHVFVKVLNDKKLSSLEKAQYFKKFTLDIMAREESK